VFGYEELELGYDELPYKPVSPMLYPAPAFEGRIPGELMSDEEGWPTMFEWLIML
jgi:hypothetical protein